MAKHSVRNTLKAVVFAALAAPAVWLLAFDPREKRPVPPGRIVVSYWEKWTGDEAAAMKRIVDDFNAGVGKDKGIWVDCLSMSDIDQKTLVATAAGVPPDVAGLWSQEVPQYAALDALEPLDDYARRHGITRAYYKPTYWDGCCSRGTLYALISTPAAAALHYNKRIFYENADKLRQAGCDPTRPPRTISELDRYAQVLDTFDPKRPGDLDRAGYMPIEPGWYIQFTGYWFGGDLYDPATDRITLDSPENVRAFEWVAGYSRRLGADAVSRFHSGLDQNFDSPQNPFMVGKLAMEQQGPWMANFIYHLAPDMNQRLVPWALEPYLPRVLRPFNYDWAAAPFPPEDAIADGPEGRTKLISAVDFDILCIPKGSKHKEEAFEFIAYVNSQPAMEKLCALHCKNTPLTSVSAQFIRSHPNPYIDVFEKLSASPDSKALPPVAVYREMYDELLVVAQDVSDLKKTPAEALSYAQGRMQERHERFRASQRRGRRSEC